MEVSNEEISDIPRLTGYSKNRICVMLLVHGGNARTLFDHSDLADNDDIEPAAKPAGEAEADDADSGWAASQTATLRRPFPKAVDVDAASEVDEAALVEVCLAELESNAQLQEAIIEDVDIPLCPVPQAPEDTARFTRADSSTFYLPIYGGETFCDGTDAKDVDAARQADAGYEGVTSCASDDRLDEDEEGSYVEILVDRVVRFVFSMKITG